MVQERERQHQHFRQRTYNVSDGARPIQVDEALYRSRDVVEILPKTNITGTDSIYSRSLECGAFRHFLLYLHIDSTSTPTTLHIEVEFLNPRTGRWHSYKQGLFASLYYEDTDVADGVSECFEGFTGGRSMRIKLTGAGTSGSAYFTVDASVEFFN